MINLIRNTINSFRAVFGNAAANAFIQATGITGSVQKAAITQLCIDLQASGLWSKMKAVYPMVTDNRNLLSYTEDFTNSYWLKQNATVTTNSITAPNGTLTADTLIDDTAGGFHFISNPAIGLGQNGNNTVSIYAKANTLNWLSAYVYDGTTAFFTYFNLSNGTIGTNASGNTATIVDAGNGWYRCSVSRNYNATAANANCGFMTANADNVNSYSGTGKSIYLWGAQFETGSTVSTYQPILTTPSAFMASQMKYNLKDARDLDVAFRLTWSGGWTYSATGAIPNGTNGFANTNLNQSTNLNPDSLHLSIYSRTNISTNSAFDIGGNSGTPNYFGAQLAAYYNGIGTISHLNSYPTESAVSSANTNTQAYYIGTRTSNVLNKAFRNGTLLATNTATRVSTLPNSNLFIASDNVTAGFTSKQYAFATIGNGLSDQDTLLLNQIVEKYQVALSRGVQAAQSFYYNSAYSNEANTYLYSTQITGTTQVSAINTLINGLKANNLWSKMKAVYPFVTDKTLQSDMAAQMKFNLVNPQDSDAAFRLAFSGGWTYSTNGAQPNGTNGYADTKFIPDNNGLTANNNSLSFYSRTAAANGAIQYYEIGSGNTTGTDLFSLYTRRSTDIAAYDTGSFTINRNSYTNTDGSGYYIGKINSDLTSKVFRNGVLKGTKTITNQATLSSFQIYIGGFNENNTLTYYSPKQMAFAHIGVGLSDAEVAILNQLVTDYETTLNRNV